MEELSSTGLGHFFQAKINKYGHFFLGLYCYTVLLNLPILTLRLTNQYDGMWNQDDYYAGAWELSNGRWFWPFLDHARFRISFDPLPDLLAIALFVLSWIVILSALDISPNWLSGLAGVLFLSGTGITCQLSYSYMSITFGVSALLAALAVLIISKQHYLNGDMSFASRIRDAIPGILISSLVIAFMMGCYQASFGITCLTALFAFMFRLSREDDRKRSALFFALRMLSSVVLGGLFYLSFLHLCYVVFNGGPADYQGFNQLTPGYIFTHIPEGIMHAYRTFNYTMLHNGFRVFRFGGEGWFHVFYLIIALGAFILLIKLLKESIEYGILFLAALLLVPLFANSFYIMAPEAEAHIQMIVPMNLVLPLMLCLNTEVTISSFTLMRKSAVLMIIPAAACFVIYCAAAQCVTDQYAMYIGRRSSEAVADGIMNAVDSQNYDYVDGEMLILGTPKESKVFYVKDQFYDADPYAQYGNWTNTLDFNDQQWQKFFLDYKRLNVSFAEGETEQTIANLPEVKAMPCYPAAGSVKNVYGVEVVKLSDSYYEQ